MDERARDGIMKSISLTAYLGLMISVSFSALWTIAVVVNGNWQLGRDTLSELGGDVPSRWYFNIAVLIAGLGSIRYSFGLANYLSEQKFGRIGSYVLAVASLGLVSVGIFPIDTGEPHTVASVFFFSVAAIAAFILTFPLAKKFGLRGVPFITTLAVIIVSFISLAVTPLPFAEAVAVGGLIVWIAVMSIQMLISEKKSSR